MNKLHSAFLVITGFLILPAASSCVKKAPDFEYSSPFYKICLTDTLPFIRYLSVDAAGASQLSNNTILWKPDGNGEDYVLRVVSGSEVTITGKGEKKPCWEFNFSEKDFTIRSNYTGNNSRADLTAKFSKKEDHVTLLGLMPEKNRTCLPAILHFPDMGSLRVTSERTGQVIGYDASRRVEPNFISITLPRATAAEGTTGYRFEEVSVYPVFPGVEEAKYEGFRRNFLNLFQVNPRLRVLANNSCSDPCAFTLFMSSMLARKTPMLADSLTALDIVRMSVERYLNGMKAYGMFGYNGTWEDENAGTDNSKAQPYDYLDTYPSLVISACNYIEGSGDIQWARKYYGSIREWLDRQIRRDRNGNGLAEYELSGNSGSWDGVLRPANWWDTVGYGFEDAFSNALTYDALNLFTRIAELTGNTADAEIYRRHAEKLRKSYFNTFYNPRSGVLAGWKSRDGNLHDYHFLVVNSMAVYYGLVPEDKVKPVMLALWNKMQEVGYNDFTLGLPGNLVSVRKEDYTHHDPRWGGGEKEDGSDAFQRYENGGASLNWSFYTLEAYRKAGLTDQYNKISSGIMEGIAKGSFQGTCQGSGMTKDWKTWSGECWGYEGFLCDGYLALLALMPYGDK